MVDLKSQKSTSFLKNGNKNNEEIITTTNFSKSNKNKEEYMRCFLVSNILYIDCIKNKTTLLLDENNKLLYKKYLNHVGEFINDNYTIYFSKQSDNKTNKLTESKNAIIQLTEELSKDNSFIKILSNLNEYTFDELKIIYLISKTALIFAISGETINLKTYIFKNLSKIVNSILENINPINLKLECVVYIVCKILRLLFKNKPYLEKIISFELFEKLYEYSNTEKFVVSSEILKCLIYMVTKPEVNGDIINSFLELSKDKISNLVYNTLVTRKDEKENYLIKRETLIFLIKTFENNKFYIFKEFFSNNVNNLKMVLIHLNDECLKIRLESINLLYYFFVDINNEVIKMILLSNKLNFYQFFEALEKELSEENANLIEKKNFIYYELERLENSNN